MESGRPLYYPGNTVKGLRGPSKKNRQRRALTPELGNRPDKVMEATPKIVATSGCVWCGAVFEDYQIMCMHCGNCQYCGHVSFGSRGCATCGNHLPDDLQPKKSPRVIVA